jgi:hypothetical protein
MADDEHDSDEDEDLEDLREAVRELRENRGYLARTIAAIQKNRRTPQEIRVLLDRSRRLVRRSVLIRLTLGRERRIH